MTSWKYRVKLSKGSLLLLHLAAAGHVWRGAKGLWVASTEHGMRVVDLRITNMIGKGILTATYKDNFPTLTGVGLEYLRDHPVSDLLKAEIRQ